MIKGASYTFRFQIPCACSNVVAADVIFWQNYDCTLGCTLPIIKTAQQCRCSRCGQTITNCTCGAQNLGRFYVTLDPSETMRFSEDRKAYVQLFIQPVDGGRFGTKKKMFTVYPTYDET